MTAIGDSMQLIRDDCKTDAEALDGKPLSGRTVGESLGAMLAMIDAVAHAVQLLDARAGE